jgi:sterol desaturase/sphingolipid hydroxylase (fatty acid hydroxylase superfamily)
VAAVILFEILLNATSLFSHSNLRLPLRFDGLLRLLLVTPDMHRVHHSVIPRETDSNFGFNLSAWDRLFGTYRPQPAAGHDDMEIGLREYRLFERMNLGWLLALPFAAERPKTDGEGKK